MWTPYWCELFGCCSIDSVIETLLCSNLSVVIWYRTELTKFSQKMCRDQCLTPKIPDDCPPLLRKLMQMNQPLAPLKISISNVGFFNHTLFKLTITKTHQRLWFYLWSLCSRNENGNVNWWWNCWTHASTKQRFLF